MNFKYSIGMRTIKTAISVFLCIIITRLVKLDNAFYAAIAAIISMESSITNSFKVGKNRMMGTIAGAAIGLVFALIQPGSAILCFLGIIVLISVCNMLNWNKAIPIAGVVFMAVMVNLNGKNPFLYSTNRIIDTFIGIAVALAVNYLIFPHNHANNILKSIEAISEKVSVIIKDMVCLGVRTDLSDLYREISEATAQLDVYVNEFRIRKNENERVEAIKKQLELYRDIYEHLKMAQGLVEGSRLSLDNVEKLKSLNYLNFKDRENSRDDLSIVFNYHIDKVIDNLRILNQPGCQTA